MDMKGENIESSGWGGHETPGAEITTPPTEDAYTILKQTCKSLSYKGGGCYRGDGIRKGAKREASGSSEGRPRLNGAAFTFVFNWDVQKSAGGEKAFGRLSSPVTFIPADATAAGDAQGHR